MKQAKSLNRALLGINFVNSKLKLNWHCFKTVKEYIILAMLYLRNS